MVIFAVCFYASAAYAVMHAVSVCPPVCLSVCLSVTFVHSVETNNRNLNCFTVW